MKRLVALAAAAALLAPIPALAWNAQGHLVISAVAWDRMTPAARARADALLKHHPDYAAWVAGVAPGDQAKVAFMKASNWPDEIRSRPGYVTDQIDGPEASRNIGYADMRVHPYWHYADAPYAIEGVAGEPAHEPNAETQLRAFTKALSARDVSEEVKSYDLIFISHIAGDVHQPLHAVSRYSKTHPKGDARGGQVSVCRAAAPPPCDKAAARSFHLYWDATIGESADVAAAMAKAARLPAAPAAAVAKADPAVWLAESHALARSTTYQDPIGPGAGPYALTAAYEARAQALADVRAALAGARLARVLNAALKP